MNVILFGFYFHRKNCAYSVIRINAVKLYEHMHDLHVFNYSLVG